jgi:hypothetical protein
MQKQETGWFVEETRGGPTNKANRAGAIHKVRRRRAQGRQLALATARRGGLAAWKKRGSGLPRAGQRAKAPESGRTVAGDGSESERAAAGARCWGGFGNSVPDVGTEEGIRFLFFLLYSIKL